MSDVQLHLMDDLELVEGSAVTAPTPMHFHDVYQLAWVCDGAIRFRILNQEVRCTPSTFILINPQEAHAAYPEQTHGWSFRMIFIAPEMIGTMMQETDNHPRKIVLFRNFVSPSADVARSLLKLTQHFNNPISTLHHREHTLLLISMLIRHFGVNAPRAETFRIAHRAVSHVQEYLQAHYADDVSLESLSEATGTSKYHLIRIFREAVGITPHAYQMSIRVERAKHLLLTGHTPSQASYAVGFFDQSHFIKTFRRSFGVSPRHFMRNP